MKSLTRTIVNLAVMVLAYFLYSFLQTLFMIPKKTGMLAFIMQLIPIGALTVIFVALLWYFYKAQLKHENPRGFDQKPHFKWRRLGFALLMAVAVYLYQMIFILTQGGAGNSQNQVEVNSILTLSGFAFQFFVAFVGPIIEEIIFRGYLFNTFFRKNTLISNVLGILVAGLVFGLLHEPRLSLNLLIYWGMGSILSTTYIVTKDLRYSILVHMINNILSLV